jgi:hypothetical protein
MKERGLVPRMTGYERALEWLESIGVRLEGG